MKLLSAGEMRELDRQAIKDWQLPGIVLMENAGQATVDQIEERYSDLWPGPVLIVSGKGNNGGDGYVIARHLMNRGWDVSVLILASDEKIKGDARVNLDVLIRAFAELYYAEDGDALFSVLDVVEPPSLIVDALFGTGLGSEVKDLNAEVINWMNGTGLPIVAVDVPSGVDVSTGQLHGPTVCADMTVTFAEAKIGHVLRPAVDYVGDLVVVDIGIPIQLSSQYPSSHFYVDIEMAAALLPDRPDAGHKGSFGHLLTIAGSKGKTGAAVLAAEAGLRSGAGLSTLACPASLNSVFEVKLTEVMTVLLSDRDGEIAEDAAMVVSAVAKGKQALVVGPGLGTGKGPQTLVKELVLNAPQPIVVDADGLNVLCLDTLKKHKGDLVLTPHPGEMARLLGCTISDVEVNRISTATDFAREYKVVLVLKGAPTIVAAPDGRVFVNGSGNPLLASGGTGDILAGLIGGFMCQGCSSDVAAVLAVFLHGATADRLAEENGNAGILASELLQEIPLTRYLLENGSE